MLESNKSPRINIILVEVESCNRSIKVGLEVMISSVQAPVSKSVFDHPKSQSTMSEFVQLHQLFEA